MTESESVALPLGDTPISSYQYILADIADYIKHFLYLFQKIFNAGGARKRRGSARRRGSGARKQGDGTGKQGGGGEDKATAHKDVTAAIAFYIFFKNFSIPRKRRGEHPAF